jgi:MFS transporter, putative metabolite:H+ symporter
LLGYLIIPSYGWRWMFAIAGVGALAVWYLRKSMPESPRWLESHGQADKAAAIVSQMAVEAGVAVPGVHETMNIAPSQPVSFRILFSRAVLRRTIFGVLVTTVVLVVMYAYITWIPIFLVKQGLSVTTSLGFSVVMSLGSLAGAACAYLLSDGLGRKPSLILMLLATTLFGFLYTQGTSPLWIMGFGFATIGAIYCCGTLILGIYLGELFATEYRLRGVGLCSTIARIVVAFSPYAIVASYAYDGLQGMAALMSVGLLFATAVAMFLGIETRARPLEVIAPVEGAKSNPRWHALH